MKCEKYKTQNYKKNTIIYLAILICISFVRIILVSKVTGGQSFIINQLHWFSSQFGLSYSFGLIQRGFIGTVIDYFSKITGTELNRAMLIYCYFTSIVFTIGTVLFFYEEIQNQKNKMYRMAIYIMAIFFITGSTYGLYVRFVGITDIWLLILTTLALFIIKKQHSLWTVTIPVVLCIAIHQAYAIMFYGIIVVYFLYYAYNSYQNEDKKNALRNIAACSIITIVALIEFIYFQVFAMATCEEGVVFSHIGEMFNTDTFDNVSDGIILYLFRTGEKYKWNYGISNRIGCTIVSFIVYLPIIFFIIKFWMDIVRKSLTIDNTNLIQTEVNPTTRKMRLMLYLIMAIEPLIYIVLFISHVDYGRWCAGMVACEIFLILLLIDNNDQVLKAYMEDSKEYYNKNSKIIIGLVVYSFLLGQFDYSNISIVYTLLEKVLG